MVTLSEETRGAMPDSNHGQLALLLRRGWIAILVGLVLGAAGGALLTKVETKTYTATASVLVTPTGADSATLANARTSGTINLDTESQLVTSGVVVSLVQGSDPTLRDLTRSKLIARVAVTVPANTEILNIAFDAPSSTAAAQGANEFANAYLKQRQTSAQTSLTAQIAKTQADLDSLTTSLKAVTTAIATLPAGSADLNLSQAQRSLLISQIGSLNTQLSALSTTVITPGAVLSQATAPTKPSAPSALLNLAGGVALGLLLGLVVAWLQVARAKLMHHPDDVPRKLGVPLLTSVHMAGPLGSATPEADVESFRRLANTVRAAVGKPGIVLLAGPIDSAATVWTATNLARALARLGDPVRFGSSSGARPSDGPAGALLTDGTVVDVTDQLRESAARVDPRTLSGDGWLVLSAEDPERSADAQTLASEADAVILMITTRVPVARCLDTLKQFDTVAAPMLGATIALRPSKQSRPAASASRPGAPKAPAVAAVEASTSRAAAEVPATGSMVDSHADTASIENGDGNDSLTSATSRTI